MRSINKFTKVLITAGLAGLPFLGVGTLARADDAESAALKAEMDALKARLGALEEKLAEKEKAPQGDLEKEGAAPVAGGPAEKPGLPTIGEMMERSGITINGYIDTSYTHLSGEGTFTSGVPNRVFDRDRNSFNLHLVDLTAAYQPTEGFGGLANLSFGEDANVFGPIDTGLDDEFDIQQAFVQYAHGPVTVLGGKFVTLAGAEVIKSPLDLNFTRSILFGYAIPFTHTGLRGSYVFNDKATFILGVNNGWDLFEDDNSQKTLELGLQVKPIDPLAIAFSGYVGNEAGAAGKDGTRSLIDMVATYTVNDSLTFVLNYDYATQNDALETGDADWQGIAGYANYKFNDQWRAALRGEFFDDADGFRTGVKQEWKEVTTTLAYIPFENVELRGEVRGDFSNEDSFVNTDGSADNSQYSFGLEAIYKFGL